ncbi:MAG TPA: hypothetical protein VF510_14915 [Ktedonobacterales bacterium]
MRAPTKSEPRVDLTQFAISTTGALLIGVLYYSLPAPLRIVEPPWLLLAVEIALIAPVVVSVVFFEHRMPYKVKRSLAMLLLVVVTLALIGSLVLLVTHLPSGRGEGRTFLRSAAVLWVINILVFASWYWETDGGGPHKRLRTGHKAADFYFPQQQGGNPTGWAPGFIDYLFLAFCFSTALSPADTSPLTRSAKVMMMIQATISGLIIVLLVARSVNVI